MQRAKDLPVFAVHMSAPRPRDLPLVERFITEAMPFLGLDTLVLEVNYAYNFSSHPELGDDGAIGRGEARRIVAAAKEAGVRVVPLFNCLGHQSWRANTFALLAGHPEFDEYPGVNTSDPDFYCRSWCPQAPGLHEIVFDLIDELVRDFEASDFHCGMDEVFIIASEHCPRCRGRNPAELFAGEVKLLSGHLRKRGVTMWMWGDRLLDGRATGIHKWEASHNGIAPAVNMIPTDVIICDWHYGDSPATPEIFAGKGFRVLSCPWTEGEVALAHLARQRELAADRDSSVSSRALGVLQTVWSGRNAFMASCLGEEAPEGEGAAKGLQAAEGIKSLSRAMGRRRDE